MSDKFWFHADDWFGYANCYGSTDHTLPPEREDDGPTADPLAVREKCLNCRVRPECAQTAVDEQWNDVWVCGTWIPGHDQDRREAGIVRQNLLNSIPDELKHRGTDV